MGLVTTGKLILASASPRRRELLKMVGLDPDVVISDVDEVFLEGESPKAHVIRLSAWKAWAVSAHHPDAWILGADTIVVINSEILGKPASRDEARQMLNRLSGREHTVLTGFTIAKKEMGFSITHAVTSKVLFKDITEDEISWYIRTSEPYDKAGGYAVQGRGAFFIKEIRGSYTNVIGLPLCEVMNTLKWIGFVVFDRISDGQGDQGEY